MTALARAASVHPVEEALSAHGFHSFGDALDAKAATWLHSQVHAARKFGPNLFLTEEEFLADPQFKGTNPRPGRNLAERFDADLGFIERDAQITDALTHLLGVDYKIMDRKFVCGVPEHWLPPWLLARIKGNPVNNLGPYIRPEFRDVTYFYGIDFHQDLIDHPARTADFITLYIYIHPVKREDSPLFVLPDSHQFGGTKFPHALTSLGEGRWRYDDERGQSTTLDQKILVGGTGYAALWHACTLHGTQPDVADSERISVRYIIARGEAKHAGIDDVNATLKGPLSLTETRVDLDAKGAAQIKTNHVAGVQAANE